MNRESSTVSRARFGTFGGVFTPTVLTILGIILFLRLGWIVGQAGLIGSIVIILIGSSISLITGFSLSSIATNMHVRTGGAYYMISRTLGIEIGGAIGIPLYFSQAISVAFYIIGFSEAFTSTFPIVDARLLSTALAVVFGLFAYVGADFALRIQYVVLIVLGSSLVSFFAGGWDHWVTPQALVPVGTAGASFWHVFAIFFPAVTGITVGLSMSGDLRDPRRSIPQGTLAAIGITTAIYLGAAIWLGTHATAEQLIGDNLIMQKIARWPFLILLGVWLSTLSSALGSVVAAPRTLQAASHDRVLPRILGSQLGSATEPRLAVLVTTVIAVSVIWAGDLNFVASIITMFFLNTYGMINLTAGIESFVGNPSFRPRFTVPWVVSLLGAFGSYAAMFLINVPATVVAILLSYGVFVILGRRSLRQSWGDIGSGVWFEAARLALIRLEREPRHVKNWRPNIIVFTSIRDGLDQLMEAGSWLTRGGGIVTFCNLIMGDVTQMEGRRLRETSRGHLKKYLEEHGVPAFAESAIVNGFDEGVLAMLQSHGIAGIEANTALMGWSQDPEGQKSQLRLMRQILALKKSLLLLKCSGEQSPEPKSRIDVWWRGRDTNAELMMLLAHIIRKDRSWERARIRLIRLVDNPEAKVGAKEDLARLAQDARVEAEALVLVKSSDEEFSSRLKRESSQTDLVFLGSPVFEENQIAFQARNLNTLLESTGPGWTILVRSGEREDVLEGS
jgi:amino acid transporter